MDGDTRSLESRSAYHENKTLKGNYLAKRKYLVPKIEFTTNILEFGPLSVPKVLAGSTI